MLDALMEKHGSDKSKAIYHGYAEIYDKILAPVRESVRAVLELGVLAGSSLRAWAEYFPNATVYGVDEFAGNVLRAQGDRIRTAVGDASNPEFLLSVFPEVPEFDLIIDDASHKSRDQQIAFLSLAGRLKPGGIYVIEDILPWREQFWAPDRCVLDMLVQCASQCEVRIYHPRPESVIAFLRRPELVPQSPPESDELDENPFEAPEQSPNESNQIIAISEPSSEPYPAADQQGTQ